MAELNFGLLNPPGSQSIGNAFVTGMDQAQEARARDLQMQQSQRQGEVTQMQLAKLRRDEQGLADFSKKVAAMGGPSDPVAIAQAYLGHPDVEMQKLGAGLMQKAQTLALFKERYPTAVAPAASPAAAAPSQPPVAAMGDFLGAGNQLMPGVQANALAPAPATTNALAPAPATVETRLADIRAQLAKLDPFIGPNGVPEAIRQEEQLKEEYKALIAPRVIAPGGTILRPGLPNYTAPAAKSEFDTLLANSGLSVEAQNAARRARIGKESTTSYEYLATLDRLGSEKDPEERKRLTARLNYLTTHAPGNTQTIKLPPLETAEQKGRGEGNVKMYDAISASARLAAKSLPALETQTNILNNTDFTTGFGTGAKKAAASVLATLGVPEAEKFATNAQTFLAATQQAVLQRQLEQKGPQTESDAQRITQTGAQLGNTPAANKFIIDVAKAQFKRDIEQRNFFDKWFTTNKTYEGAESAWYNGEGGKSLFDRSDMKAYAPKAKADKPTTPTTVKPSLADIFGQPR